MHSHNDWYGHVRILARYAGHHESKPRIWGYLQHGWNVHNGFGARTPITPGMPRFVWSEAVRRRGWAEGEDGYVVIGAPWAYLLRMEAPKPPAKREGTIYYPFHGFEKQRVHGDHARLAAEIRAHESGPVTVCLYWLDYQIRPVRQVYERVGFRVITHGYRGGRAKLGDRQFLRRQLTELLRHRRAASNRLSTALLYGASVGCDIGVYGDEMFIEDPHPIYGGNARVKRLWPHLHRAEIPQSDAAEFASTELGLAHVVGPVELADLVGWAPLSQARTTAPQSHAQGTPPRLRSRTTVPLSQSPHAQAGSSTAAAQPVPARAAT